MWGDEMRYALISKEQIKQVQDAIETSQPIFDSPRTRNKHNSARAIVKSLKPSEPVAWMCPYKYEATDTNTEYVLDHAQDGKDYMMSRLDHADVDGWRGEPVGLFALEQSK